MDKRLIAERFARARATYSREARVQQQVAERMMGRIRSLLPEFSPRRIVEFGCGTGLYSRLLYDTWRPDRLHLNDLCPEMAFCLDDLTARPGVSFVPGDAETCPLPGGVDLLTSCSTLQWFERPDRFFRRSAALLAPGGVLAFSTFGSRNLREIRALTGKGLAYPSPADLSRWLEEAGLHVLLLDEEEEALCFPSPLDVLRHLRMTGVTGTSGHAWSRGRLADFAQGYARHFGSPRGVTLTYHPVYVIAGRTRALHVSGENTIFASV